MPSALPVDSFIEPIRDALGRHRAAVVTAAPGAGKTTRIPPALIDHGRVLLLQPRRVAARAMARRIAEERGWTIGREIGWHIRFERHFARDTRLLVVTEGILTAYLQDDPLLSDVSTIVLDEFHERRIHADLGLALAKQAWQARHDLRILVMSATLDSGPVSAFLGDCPVVDVPGLLHPLAFEYGPGEPVATAVQSLLPRTSGNVLCFLPGAADINRTVADLGHLNNLDILPLHGSLDAREQDAALSPHVSRRRVIVATNIAETSLTVPGVSVVIDSGLQKVAGYDAERGVDSLTTERITLDSADQRAGRAARLGPGVARRLWDSRDRLRPHREAEIHRVDLAGPLLSILAWGASPDVFQWFDPPSTDRIAAAMALLARLDAVKEGRITDIGRMVHRLPLHPRLGRVLIAAHGSFEGCRTCAALSEPATLDHRHVEQQLSAAAKALLGNQYRGHISDTDMRRALLAGYPDRVAKRRPQKAQMAQNEASVTLASGHGALVAKDSGVEGAEWMIALDVISGRKTATTQALLRKGSPIEPEWLSPTRSEVITELDGDSVKAREVDWYDEVVLREHPIAADPGRRAELLAATWLKRGPDEESQRLLQRLEFAGIPSDISDLASIAAESARTLSDIVLTEATLSWEQRQQLRRQAPETLTVPSGRDMRIEYGADGGVSVSVKLQELFGLAETPRIGPARTPITFLLLAPNGRPVQTTQDLKSFWERTYPEVRKELRGRYPKHPWPEDPCNAPATHRTKKRSSQ